MRTLGPCLRIYKIRLRQIRFNQFLKLGTKFIVINNQANFKIEAQAALIEIHRSEDSYALIDHEALGMQKAAMKFSNVWLRWHLREILKGLSDKNAARFGAAFRTGLLNWELEDRIEDASQRRDPVAAFVKIGVGSIEKILKSVEAASAKINTFMLVVGGLVFMVQVALKSAPGSTDNFPTVTSP